MKHIQSYSKINESIYEVETMTWNDIFNDKDIEYVNIDRQEIIEWMKHKTRNNLNSPIINPAYLLDDSWKNYYIKTNGNLKVVNAAESYVIIFKNNDLLALVSIYEYHGSDFFEDNVIVYGHENIIIYNTQTLKHKKIYTR